MSAPALQEALTPESLELLASNSRHAFLWREAWRNEYVDFSVRVRSTGMYYCRFFDDPETRWRCYLNESLLTALYHPDPVIRVRAAVQAANYAGRIEGMGKSPGSRHCDAILEVRNMLEGLISR